MSIVSSLAVTPGGLLIATLKGSLDEHQRPSGLCRFPACGRRLAVT